MLAQKVTRVHQLSNGFFADTTPSPILSLRTQPYRIPEVDESDRSLAQSQLRLEAAAARESKHFLRRVKSKLTQPDTNFIAAALSRHVECNGSAVVAQIYIDNLSLHGVPSSEKFEVAGNLLLTAVQNSHIELVKLIASFSSLNSLCLALNIAVLDRNRVIIQVLLEHGADPNHLSPSTLSATTTNDLPTFQLLLQAPKQLSHDKFGRLCVGAIINGDHKTLRMLLLRLPDYHALREKTSQWNRDVLLETAIRSHHQTAFFAIATATIAWPLTNEQLFFTILDSIQPALAKDMIEALLCLGAIPLQGLGRSYIDSLFIRCTKDGLEDILRMLIFYHVPVSTKAISFACKSSYRQGVHILLDGDLEAGEEILIPVATAFGQGPKGLREKALLRLLQCGKRGVWVQQELLNAVSSNQAHLIEPLIRAEASVDYNEGECLRIALSFDNIHLVKSLFSHQVSLETLRSTFPLISTTEPLSRRLMTKLFVQKGVSGSCIDHALNEALCDYSVKRDSELLSILLRANASCQIRSLLIALEHNDAGVFDKLRSSKTLQFNGAVQWFRENHKQLFDHLHENKGDLTAHVSFLKLLVRASGLSREACLAHGARRRYECIHQFLEDGALDRELLELCLEGLSQFDVDSLSELALTASSLGEVEIARYIIDFETWATRQKNTLGSDIDKIGTKHQSLSHAELPRATSNVLEFSDERRVEALTIFFQRYLWAIPEELTAKLLRRHLEESVQCIAPNAQWPLLTIDFLLNQPIHTPCLDFEMCISLATSNQQWAVLRKLLDRTLPEDMISRFFTFDTSSQDITATEILLESPALSSMTEKFAPILQRFFESACNTQNYQMALLLASKSPFKLRITDVLDSIKAAMDVDEAPEYYSTILSLVNTAPEELEILWRHVDLLSLENSSQVKFQTLLEAGSSGPCVVGTFLTAVEHGKHELVRLFLDYWHTDRSISGRESFNFLTRLPVLSSNTASPYAFFPVLGQGLLAAVRARDVSMCQLLLEAGAPLIYNGKMLIEEAVVSMPCDTLQRFITQCIALPEFGSEGTNFALLQAIMRGATDSAKAIIQLGGSALAYDGEALKYATASACTGEMVMLEALISPDSGEATLSDVAIEAIDLLQSPNDHPERLCEVFQLLHERGLQNPTFYNRALRTLCGLKSTTWDQAQSFITYGASFEASASSCMRDAWRLGNLQLFPQLFSQCLDQSVADSLIETAVLDYTGAEGTSYLKSCEDALVVLAPLLCTKLPQGARDKALTDVACCSRASITILEVMLETGAQITEHEGETLYRICRLNDSNLNNLITRSNPPVSARRLALQRLFDQSSLQANLDVNLNSQEREALDRSCLDMIIWHQTESDTFIGATNTDLFTSMVSVVNQLSDVKLLESFLSTKQGLAFVAAYGAELGGSGMEEVLLASITNSREEQQDCRIGLFIKAMQVDAPKLLADLELQPFESEEFVDCRSNNEHMDPDDEAKAPNMYLPCISGSPRLFDHDYGDSVGLSYMYHPTGERGSKLRHNGSALGRESINRLLVAATNRERRSPLISILLEAGASSSAVDSEGRSVLYLATSQHDFSTICDLIGKGAAVDDGSLHLATCKQWHGAMEALLSVGHDIKHRSAMHNDATVLEAFLQYDHPDATVKDFEKTIKILLHDVDLGDAIWQAKPSPFTLALESKTPFHLVSALLSFRSNSDKRYTLLRRGRFRYSLLSAVEKWDTDLRLNNHERKLLVARLERLKSKRIYFAVEGSQPKDAIGVPEHLLDEDTRGRLQAWREKTCSVCDDKQDDSKDIHAHLSQACTAKHGWKDEIICTACLQQCLASKMFPNDDDKFPSPNITCWAPSCGAVLEHPILQKHAEAKRFATYDDALCQQHLHAGQSIANCARDDCRGAVWLDPVSDKDVTIISCPICKRQTCIQCNQLYAKHRNKPCPVGEEAKANARRKEEEELSAEAMKKERRCPKCRQPYHRIEGCDHIVCGRDAHSRARSLGCGFEFCYTCDADYNEIRKKGNSAHARTCMHYA